MSDFFSKRLSALNPYIPGEQPIGREYIKLNTNESPYPPSNAVKNAISKEEIEKLRLYSDPDLRVLRSTIAEYYNVSAENVFCGNGSDEILSFAFLAWGSDNGVAFPDISYGFYSVYAALYGLETRVIPLRADFTLNTKNYNNAGGLLVFANPNAPTGLCVSKNEIENLLIANPCSIILVDEAYVDFGGESAVDLIKKYNNLLVVRTFSKSRQLAGARLGYAFGCSDLIADLNRIKFSFNPYNVNRLTCLAGIAAITDDEWYRSCLENTVATRERLKKDLMQLGFKVTDSKANFLFVSHIALPGSMLYDKLKDAGILVRHFNIPRINDFTRITIGTDAEVDSLILAIKAIIREVI